MWGASERLPQLWMLLSTGGTISGRGGYWHVASETRGGGLPALTPPSSFHIIVAHRRPPTPSAPQHPVRGTQRVGPRPGGEQRGGHGGRRPRGGGRARHRRSVRRRRRRRWSRRRVRAWGVGAGGTGVAPLGPSWLLPCAPCPPCAAPVSRCFRASVVRSLLQRAARAVVMPACCAPAASHLPRCAVPSAHLTLHCALSVPYHTPLEILPTPFFLTCVRAYVP